MTMLTTELNIRNNESITICLPSGRQVCVILERDVRHIDRVTITANGPAQDNEFSDYDIHLQPGEVVNVIMPTTHKKVSVEATASVHEACVDSKTVFCDELVNDYVFDGDHVMKCRNCDEGVKCENCERCPSHCECRISACQAS